MEEKNLPKAKQGTSIQKDAYKKEIPDFKMDDEKKPIDIMKGFYTLIYGLLAQRVIDSFGAEGEQVVRRALREFGEVRGGNLRDRQLHYGLELNMINLHTYCDLPGDEDQVTNREVFAKDDFLSYVEKCEMFELWKKHDVVAAGILYCEEMHHAMWATYHEDAVVVQNEILTRGDNRCSFQVTMPKYSECKTHLEYKKGKKIKK